MGTSQWLGADPSRRPPRLALAAGLLLGALAHETVAAALVGTGVVLLVVRARPSALLPAAGSAIAVWAGLDVVDFLLHRVPAMPDPAAKVQEGFSLGVALTSAVDLLGAGVLAATQPGLVDLEWSGMFGHFDRLSWDFTTLPGWALHVAGVAALVPLVAAAVAALRWARSGDPRGPVLLLLLAETGALVVGFTAVRSAFRAFSYLQVATYYLYFFEFLLMAAAAVALSGSAWVQAHLDRVALVLGALALARGVPAYLQVQATLAPHAPFVSAALEVEHAVRDAFPRSGGSCYDGTLDRLAAAFHPPGNDGPLVMVADVACDVRGGDPKYLWGRPDGSFVLAGLSAVEGLPVGIAGEGFVAEGRGTMHPGDAEGGAWSAFSAGAFHATDISVEVDHPADGGVWIGFQSPEDNTSVTLFQGRAVVVERRTPAGALEPLRLQTVALHDHVVLRFVQVGDAVQLLVDGVALGAIPGASLDGRVGVFHHSHGPGGAQVFHDVRVYEGPDAGQPVDPVALALPTLTAIARSTR